MPTPERERELVIIGAVFATICVASFFVMLAVLYADNCRGLPFSCSPDLLFWAVMIVMLPPFIVTLWLKLHNTK